MVAGPAKRKTRAAPGFNPFMIRAAATGVEEVAQTYMGIPTIIIVSMDIKGCSLARALKSSGKNQVIRPAINIPIINGLVISDKSSVKAYEIPVFNLTKKEFSCSWPATAQLFEEQPQPPLVSGMDGFVISSYLALPLASALSVLPILSFIPKKF